MNHELLGQVSDYIHSIMYYNFDGEDCDYRPCPFETFEDALAAYNLHCKRCENRSYITLDQQWQNRLREFCYERGIRYPKKLRPRRRLRPRSELDFDVSYE